MIDNIGDVMKLVWSHSQGCDTGIYKHKYFHSTPLYLVILHKSQFCFVTSSTAISGRNNNDPPTFFLYISYRTERQNNSTIL